MAGSDIKKLSIILFIRVVIEGDINLPLRERLLQTWHTSHSKAVEKRNLSNTAERDVN